MKYKYVIVLLIGSIITLSCSKDDDGTPPLQNCRIVKIANNVNVHNISYYSDGRVQTVNTNGNNIRNFNYSGNTTISTTMIDGTFDEKSIITLNADGLIVNVRTETNSSGTEWINNAYEYNGTQCIKRTFTNSEGVGHFESLFTWSNGNLVSTSHPDGISQYEYHLDKPMQTGDYFGSLSDLMQYGQINAFYKNANLVKSTISSDGAFILNFEYTFDENGKITAITRISGGVNRITTLEYECQ